MSVLILIAGLVLRLAGPHWFSGAGTEQYPSTADLPPMMGGQDDPVLEILKGARKRYLRRGTADAYIYSGAVCAVGAVARAFADEPIVESEYLRKTQDV